MTMAFGIRVILEVLAILLIAYGIYHEQDLIEFEDELWKVLKQWAKRGFKKGKGNEHKGND